MIELIFVIVILGILAAVALPRFATIQDDANIAAENSAIGSVRSGLQAIRGRVLANASREHNVTFLDKSGLYHQVGFGLSGKPASQHSYETNVSINGYPNSLSVDTWGTGGEKQTEAAVRTPARKSGAETPVQGPAALAIVIEPDGRENYATYASQDDASVNTPRQITDIDTGANRGGLTSVIIGPATRGVIDPTSTVCVGKGWVYNSISGNIALSGTCVEP
jgi:type II secretory pathway pseudopilin PulG